MGMSFRPLEPGSVNTKVRHVSSLKQIVSACRVAFKMSDCCWFSLNRSTFSMVSCIEFEDGQAQTYNYLCKSDIFTSQASHGSPEARCLTPTHTETWGVCKITSCCWFNLDCSVLVVLSQCLNDQAQMGRFLCQCLNYQAQMGRFLCQCLNDQAQMVRFLYQCLNNQAQMECLLWVTGNKSSWDFKYKIFVIRMSVSLIVNKQWDLSKNAMM